MKVGVVVFPGSNCDHDTLFVFEEILNHEVKILWHKETILNDYDLVVVPGGFSYGDYLRSGAIARFSPIMNALLAFANRGGLVLGICNGFQILCEAHLLPGALLHNTERKFICDNVFLKTATTNTVLTSGLEQDEVLKIPIAHGEGSFYADALTLEALESNDQILFRYCDKDGHVSAEHNPNGSINDIAGICNKGRNVFGMMPHPERASDPHLGNTDGLKILRALENIVTQA